MKNDKKKSETPRTKSGPTAPHLAERVMQAAGYGPEGVVTSSVWVKEADIPAGTSARFDHTMGAFYRDEDAIIAELLGRVRRDSDFAETLTAMTDDEWQALRYELRPYIRRDIISRMEGLTDRRYIRTRGALIRSLLRTWTLSPGYSQNPEVAAGQVIEGAQGDHRAAWLRTYGTDTVRHLLILAIHDEIEAQAAEDYYRHDYDGGE